VNNGCIGKSESGKPQHNGTLVGKLYSLSKIGYKLLPWPNPAYQHNTPIIINYYYLHHFQQQEKNCRETITKLSFCIEQLLYNQLNYLQIKYLAHAYKLTAVA
jgi:hypothetical protein